MKKIISLLLVFTFGLSSCEKDDICDPNTPTTPRLVIKFYDINNPTIPKDVVDLKVIGEGKSETDGAIIFNENAIGEAKYLANGNTISIPLKTDANSTSYTLILDSQNPNAAAINKDVIKFNYTHQDLYVSRACGFKTNFILDAQDDTTTPPTVPFNQVDVDLKGLWMQRLRVIEYNIDNENETHVEVFF
jgi:hypothetical protein